MMDIHNVSFFFDRSARKRLRELLAGTCRSRRKSEIARCQRDLLAGLPPVWELLRRLDILRDLMARLSFMRSFYRIPDYFRCGRCVFGNYTHLYTSILHIGTYVRRIMLSALA